MKILHVGWGFQPFRTGGLIEYAEDLMEIQVKKGYDVNYFCTGRFLVRSNKPFVKKWVSKKGYTIYEEWNPPVISGFENGIENPLADVTESITESLFMDVLTKVKPDVVHIQEFLGFPTSLIAQLKLLNVKIVYTVEDYYYLCPTIRLVLPDGRPCRIKGEELGKQCKLCCHSAPKNNLNYKLQNIYPKIFNVKTITFLQNVKKAIFNKRNLNKDVSQPCLIDKKVTDFNARRAYNLDVLSNVDLVIAMSHKVADIFNYYKPLNNIITLNLTLKHIDDLKAHSQIYIGEKIHFGVINALSAPIKGRQLLMDLFEMINATPLKMNVEFIIMGRVDPDDLLYLKKFGFIKLTGKFVASNLNNVLNELNIDVGIVPSLWEEAYGFVGIEFLAKGIPVIGNAIGGIPDYVTPETGWLNTTCDADGLYNIINMLFNNKTLITEIKDNLINNRDKYVKSLERHFTEMDVIYTRLLNKVKDEVIS